MCDTNHNYSMDGGLLQIRTSNRSVQDHNRFKLILSFILKLLFKGEDEIY